MTRAFFIAGVSSGSGKTSVTVGVLRALARRGEKVAPLKVGPDFIDPLHHEAAGGQPSNTVDSWMLEPEQNRAVLERQATDSDVVVVEGVMGMFDGANATDDTGSTAEMARMLDLPVVLVVDVWAMARSAAAVVRGFVEFAPDVEFAGVILNRVAGEGHFQLCRRAIEQACSVPVLGGLPRSEEVSVPERHLGLQMPAELESETTYDRLADLVDAHVDLDALLARAGSVAPAERDEAERTTASAPSARIGVARDDAFCFYYRDNERLLQEAGAELVEFSPISDTLPANLDAVYLGGGYPELAAESLANNDALHEELRGFDGLIYAECGGLMYLAETLETDDGEFEMVGLLPFEIDMSGELDIGYVTVDIGEDAPFGAGLSARGQLYHQSRIRDRGEPSGELDSVYRVERQSGEIFDEGWTTSNLLASYVHLHFGSCPTLATVLVEAARTG